MTTRRRWCSGHQSNLTLWGRGRVDVGLPSGHHRQQWCPGRRPQWPRSSHRQRRWPPGLWCPRHQPPRASPNRAPTNRDDVHQFKQPVTNLIPYWHPPTHTGVRVIRVDRDRPGAELGAVDSILADGGSSIVAAMYPADTLSPPPATPTGPRPHREPGFHSAAEMNDRRTRLQLTVSTVPQRVSPSSAAW